MDAVATTLLEGLPKDGSKVSGGTIRDRLNLSTIEYGQAKKQLKEEGLVELGRGRGGTIRLTEKGQGFEPPKKKTKEESLEIAREEKQARTRDQREWDALRERAEQVGWERHPDADRIEPHFYAGDWYVEVWSHQGHRGSAFTDFFDQELML